MHSHCCRGYTAKFKPVTHVIFDLDGTIIDSEPVYEKAIQQTIEFYGGSFYPDFILKVKGCIEQKVAAICIETFNLDTTIEDLVKTYNQFSNDFLGNLQLMPGVERIIRHLHKNNIPLAIATSSNQESFELKTKIYSDLISCFHHVVCGGTDPEVKNSKPAPDIFLIAASRFDNPPHPTKCLVFEDSKNGIEAALAAEMQVVMIPEPTMEYEVWKKATMRIDTLNYIIPELFGLPPFPQEEISPVFADVKVELTEPIKVLIPEKKVEKRVKTQDPPKNGEANELSKESSETQTSLKNTEEVEQITVEN